MAFIQCGKFFKGTLYIILCIIFFVFRTFISVYFVSNPQFHNEPSTNNGLKQCSLFFTLLMSIGMSLTVFLKYFTYRGINDEQKSSIFTINKKILKANNETTKNKDYGILVLIFVGFLECITFQILLILEQNKIFQDFKLVQVFHSFQFFAITYGYVKFLKGQLYFHHKVSLAVIFSITLILGLYQVIKGLANIEDNLMINILIMLGYIIVLILSYTGLAACAVMDKKLMESYFLEPIDLIYIKGLISLTSTLIFIGIISIIRRFKNDFWLYIGCFQDISNWFINVKSKGIAAVIIIFYIIGSVGYNFYFQKVNFYYSPTHCAIADPFNYMFSIILEFIILPSYSPSAFVYVFFIICFLTFLFFSLVFNEIIILNIKKFNENTKQNVADRAEEENVVDNEILNKELLDESSIDLKISYY